MKYSINALRNYKLSLQNINHNASSRIDNTISDNIRIDHRNNQFSFYLISTKGDTKGKYLSSKNGGKELAAKIAQNQYYKKVLNRTAYLIKEIDKLISKLEANSIEGCYDSLSKARQELVHPLVLNDKQFTKEWLSVPFNSNPYNEEHKLYKTLQGEFVRSKSELLLANLFYELKIPYRYEAELILSDGSKVYPDFTLLNPVTREVVYFEHFGMMDNEEYRNNALHKINKYASNDIYLGKNLIASFESIQTPIDISLVRKTLIDLFQL